MREINVLISRLNIIEPEFDDDTDEEFDEETKNLFANAQTKIEKKELLQYIVKKINGMGAIRQLHKIFIEERGT